MIRRSRGKSQSSDEQVESESEWVPSRTIRSLIKGVRKPDEEKWSQVLKFDALMDENQPTFSIVKALKSLGDDTDEYVNQMEEDKGYIIYHDYRKRANQDFDISKCQITEDELRLYAEKVIIIRKNFLEQAKFLEKQELVQNEQFDGHKPDKRIELNRKFERPGPKRKITATSFINELSMDQKYLKKRKNCDLCSSDMIDIVHSVKIDHLSHDDAAQIHKVKPRLVADIIKKSNDDQEFLKKQQQLEKTKCRQDDLIAKVAKSMYESPEGIRRSQDVINELWNREQIKASHQKVCKIMREHLNLQYKLLKRIAFTANSNRCLIQRQEFAKSLIDLLLRGQTVINIDESWINLKDYSRFCWRERGVSNSSNVQVISPRISLFIAIDTSGEILFSMTQVNTDQPVKCLFLNHLVAKLDIDRPGWREDTVILMDNASYNRGDDIIKHIKKLKLRVMFTAAYSYDASPVEYFFGYLKQGIIMQPGQSSGKRGRPHQKDEINEKISQHNVLVCHMLVPFRIFELQKALILINYMEKIHRLSVIR